MAKTSAMVRGTPDPALGAAIRQAREDAHLSQAELAVHAGLAVGTISRLEREKSSDPSWSSVRAMARVLGLSMKQLGALVDAETGDS
jgi:transcriptional regulator with XRE-family HTH domain